MLSFLEFITEAKSVTAKSTVSSNTKGVLHEILTGYHLNNGKHMKKHEDVNGLSPQEVHDQLKSTISDEDYNKINARAISAAQDLKNRIGGKVKHVHWTSKPGDIERTTGIKSTQKEDPSDIIITDHTGKHHGISLKVSDGSENVPVSNPGMEATHGAQSILDAHREHINTKFKALGAAKNKQERKDIVRSNPKMNDYIKAKNKETLNNIVDHMHKKMSGMNTEELSNHIRHKILYAKPTPLQANGHNHLRHTSYETKTGTSHKAINPHTDYEHILQDHKNIGLKKAGNAIVFTHKGVPFARHRIKFESQSDPMSVVKGSGEEIPMRKNIATKQKEKMPSDNSFGGSKFHSNSEIN